MGTSRGLTFEDRRDVVEQPARRPPAREAFSRPRRPSGIKLNHTSSYRARTRVVEVQGNAGAHHAGSDDQGFAACIADDLPTLRVAISTWTQASDLGVEMDGGRRPFAPALVTTSTGGFDVGLQRR